MWINVIPVEEATGKLKTLYDRMRGPRNTVDNIMRVHGLRPHTLEGHLALYKNVLHHSANTLPLWLMECIGLYVSLINKCEYCFDHHYEGLRRLLGDDQRASGIRKSLEMESYREVLNSRQAAALDYAGTLTRDPSQVAESDVQSLRSEGFDDGEILEINQIVSYFAYANRVALGLGISTSGDVLGLSPSAESDDWAHR